LVLGKVEVVDPSVLLDDTEWCLVCFVLHEILSLQFREEVEVAVDQIVLHLSDHHSSGLPFAGHQSSQSEKAFLDLPWDPSYSATYSFPFPEGILPFG
jgi:hypothetical protein